MAYDPIDSDNERTIIKPTPGGRPRAGAVGGRGLSRPLSPPANLVNFDFAQLANSSFNVIVGAAAQLLNLGRRLRGSVANRDVVALRGRAVEEIRNFERVIMAAGVQPEQARAAHYALCATLDDIVLNTPWGAYSAWASNSLVSTFHVDVSGGERFFDLLTHLHKDPGTNRDVLALMYLCLSIGFEGRLRVMDQGALELSRIRESLYRTLRQVYGDFERELSPHWRGVEARYRPLRSTVALWTIASAAIVALVAGYFLFSYLLNDLSDGTLRSLAEAPPNGTPTLAVQSAAPLPRVAPAAIETLRSDLAPEIAAHQLDVIVRGTSLVVRIHNAGMFASGSAEVEDKFRPVIARIGEAVARQKGRVQVDGYTDSQPIHSLRFPSNWELSTARAQAVADLLGSGIARDHLTVAGRGETSPIYSNDSAAGRDANRRTELVVSNVATAATLYTDPALAAAPLTPRVAPAVIPAAVAPAVVPPPTAPAVVPPAAPVVPPAAAPAGVRP
jgi:type VI secretion system protein ImpK